MSSGRPNVLVRTRTAVSTRWEALRARRPAVRHLGDAWRRLQDNNGSQYAGAITYFSFLALFPLLLLAGSVAAFALRAHPAAEQTLLTNITENFPGDFGVTLRDSVTNAIDARAAVGVIGLAGVLLTGLAWIGNLRAAIDAVWGLRPAKRNFVAAKAANLVVLLGLGLGSVVTLGLTVVGTSLTDQTVRALGWSDVGPLVKALGLLLAVLGDVVIFWWLLVRLPAVAVPPRVGLQAALVAAAGFEVLKVVGTYTVAHTTRSPTAGPFAGIVAVLIWIQLVARLSLFCVALTATLTAERTAVAVPVPSPALAVPEAPVDVLLPSPRAVAGLLVGAGAVIGAVIAAVVLGVGRAGARRRDVSDRV